MIRNFSASLIQRRETVRRKETVGNCQKFCIAKALALPFLFPSLAILLILKRFFKKYILFLKLLLIFCLSVSFNSVFQDVLHEKTINDIVS